MKKKEKKKRKKYWKRRFFDSHYTYIYSMYIRTFSRLELIQSCIKSIIITLDF